MPLIKLGHVVSFSSEDSSFPSENLLLGDTYKKWKCKSPGEASASVILQLDKASVINSVDIGNEFSAFVEVSVGRSGAANNEFQTLVVGSSFMSPLESKQCSPGQRVRMFGPDNLTKPACFDKWDRIKITCTQPFNKSIQYGLSFIALHAPEQKQEEPVKKLGRFALRDDDEDEVIPVGSLFAKRKNQGDTTVKGAASVREASLPTVTARNSKDTPPKLAQKLKISVNDTRTTARSSQGSSKQVAEKRIPRKDTIDSPKEKLKNKHADTERNSNDRKKDDVKPLKRPHTATAIPQANPKKAKPKVIQRKPFNKLLDGTVFVLSGYQNPGRQQLRDKAMEMGGKYKPDWCSGCTHLICAFPNTPKFQQVRGKGHIVSKQWIEDCYSERKRLPWRRYAIDRKDLGKDESEEEIFEEISSPSNGTYNDRDDDFNWNPSHQQTNDSGSDTEDEIERVKLISLQQEEARKKLATQQSSVAKEAVSTPLEEDEYAGDTDDDDDLINKRPDTSNIPMPYLPDFFKNKTFYIHREMEPDTKVQLKRYIIAFKGTVSTDAVSDHIDFLLAVHGDDITKIVQDQPGVIAVTPEWVWECNDAEKMLSTTPYEIIE